MRLGDSWVRLGDTWVRLGEAMSNVTGNGGEDAVSLKGNSHCSL